MSGSAPLTRTITATIPPATLLVDTQSPVAEAPYAGTVTAVRYIPTAAVTGAASPSSRTLTLYNRGQTGVGTTVVATQALTSGHNLAQYDEFDFTLSVVAGATTVAAGDVLEFESLHVGGTGLADPGGKLEVDIARA